MTLSLIIAATHQQAYLTAEVDWRWQRRGIDRYEMPNGEIARIITNGERMRGLLDADIYLAWDWDRLPDHDLRHLRALIAMGRFTVKEPVIGERP